MEIITEEQFDKLINVKKLVIVDFFATWCMPCRMLAPIMERVESSMQDVKFYSVDIDEGEEISKRYRILVFQHWLLSVEVKRLIV